MHVLESFASFTLVWVEPHMSAGVPAFHDFDLQRLLYEGGPATGSAWFFWSLRGGFSPQTTGTSTDEA